MGSFLPLKSKNLPTLKSIVVYKYICAGCGASYVGQTTRHWLERIREHLKTDKNSHIFQHINKNITCKNKCNDSCFSIIDTASTEFTLKIKEAMHIEWLTPSLNKQKTHINLSINI